MVQWKVMLPYITARALPAIWPYVKYIQSGHWKEFTENGNLKEEGEYVNGEKEGAWKHTTTMAI